MSTNALLQALNVLFSHDEFFSQATVLDQIRIKRPPAGGLAVQDICIFIK